MKEFFNKISEIKFSVGCMVLPWCKLFQVPRSLKILIIFGTSNPQLRPLLNMQSSIWNPLNNIYPCCSDPISVWYTYSKTTYVRALWIGNWIFLKSWSWLSRIGNGYSICIMAQRGPIIYEIASQFKLFYFILVFSCVVDYLAQVENRKNYPTLSDGGLG